LKSNMPEKRALAQGGRVWTLLFYGGKKRCNFYVWTDEKKRRRKGALTYTKKKRVERRER